jgi:hypothetical protein
MHNVKTKINLFFYEMAIITLMVYYLIIINSNMDNPH